MKKRIIAAVLTALMLSASLAACSGSKTDNAKGADKAQTVTLNQNAAEFLMDLLKKYFSYHLDVTDLKSERFFDNNR